MGLRRAKEARTNEAALIIGLGRFGGAVATTLEAAGYDVLGVDIDPKRVQLLSQQLAHVVEADLVQPGVPEQLGVTEFAHAVVAVSAIEQSALITLALVQSGVPVVWAEATSIQHGEMLRRLGAHQVVFPYQDSGRRVAHLLSRRPLERLDLDGTSTVAAVLCPARFVGQRFVDIDLGDGTTLQILCIRQVDGSLVLPATDPTIAAGDLLVIAGKAEDVDRFR